ncbi:MAG TPA: hypothetical protein VD995_09605 [Azospirillum sp.]|nr:hypothetical protein [Azospirillum sp.]
MRPRTPRCTNTHGHATDKAVAPEPVLRALDLPSWEIEVILTARARGAPPVSTGPRVLQRHDHHIRAEAEIDGARFVRLAVVRFTNAPEQPFLVRSWRRDRGGRGL